MATSGLEISREAITTAFKTGWGSTCLIDWENQPFTTPQGGTWGRFRIIRSHALIPALSSPASFMKRELGNLYLNLFAPQDSGSKLLYTMADTFESIFGLTTLHVATGHDIIFGTTEVSLTGLDAGWASLLATIPFRRDFSS